MAELQGSALIDFECVLCAQKVQSRADEELVAAHRSGSLQVLQQLGQLRWSLAELDTLPFGLAVPLQEALQLLRDCPPSGTPSPAVCRLSTRGLAMHMTVLRGVIVSNHACEGVSHRHVRSVQTSRPSNMS